MIRSLLSLLVVLAINTNTVCSAGEHELPAQDAILNFGKVDDHLYRGAQLDSEGIKALKKLGVKLIVNLRQPWDGWKDEEAKALANGILYTNIPMSGVDRPQDAKVRQVLALFETSSTPIFVHCQHGCDRTGMVVACYRIQHYHWSSELALREAERHGISKYEDPMRRYVKEFEKATKPEFQNGSGPQTK
jgi:protein tyrosine/serine phosphatase